MAIGRTKILPVPYWVQPTSITCQSTCLKMFAAYLDARLRQSADTANENIRDIWTDINTGTKRPVKARNAHANMKWWLQTHFPSLRFEYLHTRDPVTALEAIIRFIDAGFPILMSVSHASVVGHIILVVGYENYVRLQSTLSFDLVVHDPYGRFDPSLTGRLYGKKRMQGGMSLMTGGEMGPGAFNHLQLEDVSRRRIGDKRWGMFYMISARGSNHPAAGGFAE